MISGKPGSKLLLKLNILVSMASKNRIGPNRQGMKPATLRPTGLPPMTRAEEGDSSENKTSPSILDPHFPTSCVEELGWNIWTKLSTLEQIEPETLPLPNFSEDHDPLDPSAWATGHVSHFKTWRDYANQVFAAY